MPKAKLRNPSDYIVRFKANRTTFREVKVRAVGELEAVKRARNIVLGKIEAQEPHEEAGEWCDDTAPRAPFLLGVESVTEKEEATS